MNADGRPDIVVTDLSNERYMLFHNDGDGFVNPNETRDMITRLQAAGAHPKVTMYSSGDHNCWDKAYDESELFKWMMEQHRKK